MKIKNLLAIIFFLLGISESAFSQNSYELIFSNCTENSSDLPYSELELKNIHVYDLKTDTKIKKLKKIRWNSYSFKTNSFKIKVSYKNIFNQPLDTIIAISPNEKKYTICNDKLLDNNIVSTIEKSIKLRKKWSLNYQSTGCFHWDNGRIELTYKKDKIYLVYKVKGEKSQKILLNKDKIKALISFEKQLKLMNKPNGGCTTVDSYDIKSSFENYRIQDSSCVWNGYHYLKETLGLK